MDGEWGTYSLLTNRTSRFLEQSLTGVKSRSSSTSVADVAASIKSSHLFPCTQAAVCGSADSAFRSFRLPRRPNSLDLVRSCFGFRALCVMDDLRGRCTLLRCNGGKVDERPGGEWPRIDGSSSRGRADWNGGRGSCLKWSRNGGSSMDERMRSRPMSWSEWPSFYRQTCMYVYFCRLTISDSQSEARR